VLDVAAVSIVEPPKAAGQVTLEHVSKPPW
jgi:hypothetical protein